MSLAEKAADGYEVDSWAEVMAAVGMAADTANRAARAGAVQAENPLFQSMGAKETAMAVASIMEEVAAVEMTVTEMVNQMAATTTTAAATSEMDESMAGEEVQYILIFY